MEAPGLLSLSDDLLLQILLKAGAPAVACCAALCARLRAVQQQLAALPAFTSGASFEVDRGAYRTDTEHVERAVLQAREGMPAAVDFALVFVWQSRELGLADRIAREFAARCQALLPPGTHVAGCCAAGLFAGTEDAPGVEIDPVAGRAQGASVLLGRLPGCDARAVAGNSGRWDSERQWRKWLGIGQEVEPAQLLLFVDSEAANDASRLLDGLHKHLPQLLVTGGVASADGLITSSPSSAGPVKGRGPGFVGLLLCHPSGGGAAGASFVCGAVAAQGMRGKSRVLTALRVTQEAGFETEEGEQLFLLAAGDDLQNAALLGLAAAQQQLGFWAAPVAPAAPGTFEASAAAGGLAAVIQLVGVSDEGEPAGMAQDAPLLAATLAAAARPGMQLCAQSLSLSREGAQEALTHGAAQLAAARPAANPLLPTAPAGLVVVSCTGKGQAMHGHRGVDGQIIHAATKMPFAGFYADGEIGPEVTNGRSALWWANAGSSGPGGAAGSSAAAAAAAAPAQPRGVLQGFTTVVTSLGAAPA